MRMVSQHQGDEEEWDVEQAHRELDEYVSGIAADHSEVRRFLEIQGEQSTVVTVEGAAGRVDIRVVAMIPWSVRARIGRFGADAKRLARQEADEWRRASAGEDIEIHDPDPIEIQRPMYEVLADLCLDSPWNDWRTWAGIDVRTGAAPDMLERILAQITPQENQIKSFRSKR